MTWLYAPSWASPISLIPSLIHCICDYPLDLVETHLFHCRYSEKQIAFHNVVQMPLHPPRKMGGFMLYLNKPIAYCSLPLNLLVNELTLHY